MKRILVFMLVLCVCMSGTVHAFELQTVGPETTFLESLGKSISEDVDYLRDIAFSYKERFVVTEENYIDISAIDKFYKAISEPLSLSEIDSGKLGFSADKVVDTKLRKELNLFRVIGGLSGCSAAFEPVCYFRIYRNIALVGGYTRYDKVYQEPGEAYWQYICNVENMTKEIVPYHTRITYLERTKEMYNNMSSDNRFKVFLLVDGKINSIWERKCEE